LLEAGSTEVDTSDSSCFRWLTSVQNVDDLASRREVPYDERTVEQGEVGSMRFDKRSRKIRVKKKKKKHSIKASSFLGYLAIGVLLLGLFYFVLYRGHEKQLRRIRQEKIQDDFDRICAAVILRFQDLGTYPSDEEGIAVLVKKGSQPSASGDPSGSSGTLERIPLDPWQNPYVYRGSERADGITLICWGADGMQGGAGEAADVIRQGCRSTALPLR